VKLFLTESVRTGGTQHMLMLASVGRALH
jgi:hypothetical protein